MLISNSKYDANDIVTFKLSNGDEIVGKVLEDTGFDWKVERPCTVVPSQKGIMLIASMFTTDPDIKISLSKNHVLIHAPTAKQVKDYYLEVTTGIKPVSGSVANAIISGF
jgi:hypothetical protein